MWGARFWAWLRKQRKEKENKYFMELQLYAGQSVTYHSEMWTLGWVGGIPNTKCFYKAEKYRNGQSIQSRCKLTGTTTKNLFWSWYMTRKNADWKAQNKAKKDWFKLKIRVCKEHSPSYMHTKEHNSNLYDRTWGRCEKK